MSVIIIIISALSTYVTRRNNDLCAVCFYVQSCVI